MEDRIGRDFAIVAFVLAACLVIKCVHYVGYCDAVNDAQANVDIYKKAYGIVAK